MERVRFREMNGQQQPLEQRIALALSDKETITASALAHLFNEVEATIAEVETAVTEAKERALDPLIEDPQAARQQRDECEFRLERLKASLPPLQQRYSEQRLMERKAAWRKDLAQVKGKRDATADKLQAIYELTEQLIPVLQEANEVDQEVARINRTAPNGEHDRLLTVECAARHVNGVPAEFSLMNIKLPAFHKVGQLLWPPPTPPIDVRQIVPAKLMTHPGDHWAEAMKVRDEERQQEAKRVADYYRNQTREREDRDNAEARAKQARRQASS
jgi:hypothetical protein